MMLRQHIKHLQKVRVYNMPYIGRSTDGFGVRNRFLYLASADDTSVSGADANGATLTFTDGAYVDVYLNGVLLKAGTDYNTNTASTIAGLSAMSANDEVTVVVYDVFAVSDTVSATSGGTFSGGVTVGSTLDVTGNVSLDGGNFVFNESGKAKDFRVEGDTKTHMLFVDGSADVVGIGGTPATGNNIVTHIKQGDSGAASGDGYHSYSNLIVETNAGEDGGGISIHGDNTSLLQIAFGDPEDANAGIIFYQHSDNTMHFYTNAQRKLKIAENGTHTFKMSLADGSTETAIWGSGTSSYIQAVSGELFARDSAGNNTQISPHNFLYIPDGKSEEHAWSFINKKTTSNIKTEKDKDGKDIKVVDTTEAKDFTYVNVDMMKVVREVEKLTGTKLVYTGNQDGDDGSTVKDDIIAGLIKRIEALEEA